MEKREVYWLVDMLEVGEWTWRRLMMKRESKMQGRLGEGLEKLSLSLGNVHVRGEDRSKNVGSVAIRLFTLTTWC